VIDLYPSGRFPLDRFVTETVTLEGVEDAFAKMQRGEVLWSVAVFERCEWRCVNPCRRG